jgi:hypothetical protein
MEMYSVQVGIDRRECNNLLGKGKERFLMGSKRI